MTFRPPELVDPLVVVMPDPAYLERTAAYSVYCEGVRYGVRLEPGQDALILFDGESDPMKYPVSVFGGRNVIVRGLEIKLETQPGCGVGELPNSGDQSKMPNRNVNPRVPANTAMHLQQSGTSYVEGTFFDLNGHEADCILPRNPAGMSNDEAKRQRDVFLQNVACYGIEGHPVGIHGDLVQNQGYNLYRTLGIENVTVRTSYEGLVLHPWHGQSSGSLHLRRYNYGKDDRFFADGPHDNNNGVAFAAHADTFTIEDVWLQLGVWGLMNDKRLGQDASRDVTAHGGVHVGSPPRGDFAPVDKLGRHYVSPFG